MSVVYLNNGVFDEAPNGGEYIRNKSFVVLVNNNSTNETEYYVRLMEEMGDSEYKGINFNTKDQLNEENAYNYVTNLSGSELYPITGSSNSVVLNYVKAKIPQCTSVFVYAPDSGDA